MRSDLRTSSHRWRAFVVRIGLNAVLIASALSGVACTDEPGSATSNVDESPYWKNTLQFPRDPFVTYSDRQAGWVKFTIMADEPSRVFFHDGREYSFHYDFGADLVPAFRGMSHEAFEQATMHEQGQKAFLGAVIFPPQLATKEYGIQLVRQDAYPAEVARDLIQLVKDNIAVKDDFGPVSSFYFPTFEQAAVAEQGRQLFEESKLPVSSSARWANGDECYATGWALGRLNFVPGAEIDQAYRDGRLKSSDVLLTDGVPAEVPHVAGIVTLAPATPNSHVAILAGTFGVPFVYPTEADERRRIRELDGKKVVLRANPSGYGERCQMRLVAVGSSISPELEAELLSLKKPKPVKVCEAGQQANDCMQRREHLGALSRSTDQLQPSDVRHFGGKATNFRLLRDAIVDNSPKAIALSFDLWQSFMDQTLADSDTLGAEIERRLAPFSYPPDPAALSDTLKSIRDLIKGGSFSSDQRAAILSALSGFDNNRKIRFRSSTNVEDTLLLTGAGLYDSKSGCIADDIDDDLIGPSHCDATKAKERGVFRAIRRVYASFFNDNAVMERLRHQVVLADAGMAVLVHYSYPDEQEAANGVATLSRQFGSFQADLVTHPGAESITNPTNNAKPELVDIWLSDSGHYPTFRRQSELMPLGAKVMLWEDDYNNLGELLNRVAKRFAQAHPEREEFKLDLEYKKLTDGSLVVKQVRELPLADKKPSVTPYLIPLEHRLCTMQTEFGTVWEMHRLKARWTLNSDARKLDDAGRATSFYPQASIEYALQGRVTSQSGAMTSWPSAAHRTDRSVHDSWTAGEGAAQRTLSLETRLPSLVSPRQAPILFLDDGQASMRADYSSPVPTLTYEGVGATSSETTMLMSCDDPSLGPLQERTVQGPDGISVRIAFHYNTLPNEPMAKTWPLGRFVSTEIRGLTTSPIVLEGYFSQTLRPGHHNFYEDFVFEPQLEDGLPQTTLDELRSKNIRAISVSGVTVNDNIDSRIKFHVLTTDGVLKPMF